MDDNDSVYSDSHDTGAPTTSDAAPAVTEAPIYIDGLFVSAADASKLSRSKYYTTDTLEPNIDLYRRCLNDEACWTISSARPGNDVEELLSDDVCVVLHVTPKIIASHNLPALYYTTAAEYILAV